MSNSLQPHGLQHVRLPCPSPSPELVQTNVHWINDAIQQAYLLSSPSLPAFNFSQHQGFASGSALRIRWPKYRSFSISHSNEYSGLISFRIDWFDLLAVQRILKSLLQHHSSKASILWHSAFFMVQFSHPHITTRKTTALKIQTVSAKQRLCFFICGLGWS